MQVKDDPRYDPKEFRRSLQSEQDFRDLVMAVAFAVAIIFILNWTP